MSVLPPIHLRQWIEQHKHLLKPPVGNKVFYTDNKDFIVMVVGGPNSRKDFHYNEGEELFYQIEGDISLWIMEEGVRREIRIRAGEMFLLPPGIPHCPQRGPHTIGLVIERYRSSEELDAFLWYCENCGSLLHKVTLPLKDIVADLPRVMGEYYENKQLCTCKQCGTVMQAPNKV